MKEFTISLKQDMLGSLHTIGAKDIATVDKAREAIFLLENAFGRLKTFICSYDFKDEKEEVYFFRDFKPSLFCHLAYYRKVYEIETGGKRKESLEEEILIIRRFYDRYREFCRYYRSGDTHFDSYYFLRGKPGIHMADAFYWERDPACSSCGDLLVTQILANELLEKYLNEELNKLKENEEKRYTGTGLIWTLSKTDLCELSVPILLLGGINGGRITQQEYRKRLERAFNIDLETFSRTLCDLKIRKNPTQFLDKLRKALRDYLDSHLD